MVRTGQIVQMVAAGQISLSLDSRITSEYRDVLLRLSFRFDRSK